MTDSPNTPPLSIVYVLTNPAMPGLVKIGRTSRADANVRIGELYSTGVPVPFTLAYACKVPNSDEVEKALHIAFAPSRINPNREFFRIEVDQPIAILKLLHVDAQDATAEVSHQPTGVDAQSIAAATLLKARRPNLNFIEMGIQIGETLQSVHGPTTVMVMGERKVKMGDDEMFLATATRQVLGLEYNVAPAPHWTYKGRLLSDMYEETYAGAE